MQHYTESVSERTSSSKRTTKKTNREQAKERLFPREGKAWIKVATEINLVLDPELAYVFCFLVDWERRHADKQYDGWFFLTEKHFSDAFPKVTNRSQRLIFNKLKGMVSMMRGRDLEMQMPARYKRYRWLRTNYHRMEDAITQVQNTLAMESSKVEKPNVEEWALACADLLHKVATGKSWSPITRIRWAEEFIAAASRKNSDQKMVEKAVGFYAHYAKRAADLGLPTNIPDAKRFCSPRVFSWIVDKMNKARAKGAWMFIRIDYKPLGNGRNESVSVYGWDPYIDWRFNREQESIADRW